VSQTLNLGEETMSFLKNSNVDEKSLKAASSFVSTTQDMLSQFKPQENNIIDKFLSDVAGHDHGVGTTMVAALMAKAMGIESTYGVDILGMAALLHNIGLQKLPKDLHLEDENQMTTEEVKIFRTHTEIGAQELSKISGINAVVIHAVKEHHVRRYNQGFPLNIQYGKTAVVSQIVGVSSEFVHAMALSKLNPKVDPFEIMANSLKGFSLQLVKAFQKTMGKA